MANTISNHSIESRQSRQSRQSMHSKPLSIIQDVFETINIYKSLLVCSSQEDVTTWVHELEAHDFSCGSVDDFFNNPNIRMVVIQANEVKYLLDDDALDNINVVFMHTHEVLKTVIKPLSVLLKNPQYYFVL